MTATLRLAFAFPFCLLSPASAAPIDPGINADTLTLLDNHASPNDKLEAAHRLGQKGPAAERAIPALLRQTHYSLEPVREKAREALIRVAGEIEANRLLTNPNPPDRVVEAYKIRRLALPPGWNAAPRIRELLESDSREGVRLALDALKKLAIVDRQGASVIDQHTRAGILAAVERLELNDPALRPEILPIVEALGPTSAPAVRLLLRMSVDGWMSKDPVHVDQVRRLITAALTRGVRRPDTLEGLADALADRNPKVAAAAQPLVVADIAADSFFKFALAQAAARQVASGHADAAALLKRYDVEPDRFAAAVFAVLGSTNRPAVHARLAGALVAAGAQPAVETHAALRDRLATLLIALDAPPAKDELATAYPARAEDLDALAAALPQLLTGPAARQAVEAALLRGIAEGRPASARALAVAKPDPTAFARRLEDALHRGSPQIRFAAARTLATLGGAIDHAPTRALLDRCLRSPTDPALRQAAAEALGTPQAHALARVPDLLRDLRADRPTTRQLAARQLQSLALEPAEITTALIRATDAGDLATREGLCLALEHAFTTSRPTRDALADLAAPTNTNPTTRTYARAALRSIGPTPAPAQPPRKGDPS